ncbi:MAG: hypothetical protein LBQ12_11405 [Deltaproteobacteria bacterium]|jgi:hypothetical protein|nr:hypothetical protein [Deltaproteobacteria bacterium]
MTPVEFVELYLAPLGNLPRVTWGVSWLYLACGLRLSKMTGNPNILLMKLLAVAALGNIVEQATINRFRKELVKMDTDVVQYIDTLTDGHYSATLAFHETLEVENKTLENKTLENKTKDSKTKDSKIADLTPFAARGMYADGMSVEEISAKLNLEMSELVSLLKGNGSGK